MSSYRGNLNLCHAANSADARYSDWMQRAVPYPLHIANDDEEVYGLGHWDANNMIFRCIVRCPNCHANFCNRRMWWPLDDHDMRWCT